MNTVTNSATIWQYRRKKRRVLSPVARGLIVGLLFTGWIIYSILNKNDIDFLNNNAEDDGFFHETLNSEKIMNDFKTSFKLNVNDKNKERINDQLAVLRKGK